MADATLAESRTRSLAPSWQTISYVLPRWPVFPLITIFVLLVVGIFAPWLSPHDPLEIDLEARNTPPFWYEPEMTTVTVMQRVDKLSKEARFQISLRDAKKKFPEREWVVGDTVDIVSKPGGTPKHFLGADQTGRDILARIIHGAKVSLLVTAVSLSSGLVVGTVLGIVAGYADQIFPRYGNHIDEFIMRIVEITYAVPTILIALVIVIVFGQSFVVLLGLLAFVAWNAFPRNVRAEVLALKTSDYVALAKVAGAGPLRIMFVHIFPGVTNTILVIATLRVGQLILTEAILSFLGDGCRRPGIPGRRLVDRPVPRSVHLPGGNGPELPG